MNVFMEDAHSAPGFLAFAQSILNSKMLTKHLSFDTLDLFGRPEKAVTETRAKLIIKK